MRSPDEGSSTTVVIEMEPGWIYVKVAEPKQEPEQIERLLQLSIDHWLQAHPQFVINKTQGVTQHGRLEGINVWYRTKDQTPAPTEFEGGKQPAHLTFKVKGSVSQQIPVEHVEALIDEAMRICSTQQAWQGSLVVINPGGVAVIVDKQANRGAVVPVETVYQALESVTRQAVQTWVEAPSSRRHVVLIDGSWFTGRKTHETRPRIIEAGRGHANLTYDKEPHSRNQGSD